MTLVPVGPTRRMSRSAGHVCQRLESVTVILVMVPHIPATLMIAGYGVAWPWSGMVIAPRAAKTPLVGVSLSRMMIEAVPSVQLGTCAVIPAVRGPSMAKLSMAVAVKTTEVWPAGRMTVGGSESRLESLVERVTRMSAVGGALALMFPWNP